MSLQKSLDNTKSVSFGKGVIISIFFLMAVIGGLFLNSRCDKFVTLYVGVRDGYFSPNNSSLKALYVVTTPYKGRIWDMAPLSDFRDNRIFSVRLPKDARLGIRVFLSSDDGLIVPYCGRIRISSSLEDQITGDGGAFDLKASRQDFKSAEYRLDRLWFTQRTECVFSDVSLP